MRNLASIQRIVDIQPIIGADKILLATVLGWKCIVSVNDNFKVGDLVVYFEIDSRLDCNNPIFSFMEKRNYKVKTMKMRGAISQGLIMPISILPGTVCIEEGTDCTEALKVTKIDTDEAGECSTNGSKKQNALDKFLMRFKIYRKLRGFFQVQKKGWPSEIPHTDETRIQVLYNKLKEQFDSDKKWYVSTKIDGQSATYYYKKGNIRTFFRDFFGIYSRELRKGENDNSNWSKIAKELNIKNKLKQLEETVWIQGEIAGPGIQKNKNKFTKLRFFVFNIFFPERNKFARVSEMVALCDLLGFEHVPISDLSISLKGKTMEDLIAMSHGKSEWSEEDLREGIVIRDAEDDSLNRISFKVVSPEFLLKYNV